jgi:hypothetical protein
MPTGPVPDRQHATSRRKLKKARCIHYVRACFYLLCKAGKVLLDAARPAATANFVWRVDYYNSVFLPAHVAVNGQSPKQNNMMVDFAMHRCRQHDMLAPSCLTCEVDEH